MSKELIQEYADNEYPKCGDYNTHRYGNDRMNEWVVQNTVEAIKLSDGHLVGFEKPRVHTDFCFSDEGADYELYKGLHSDDERMKRYFFNENLKPYDELLEKLEGKEDYSHSTVCLYKYNNGNYKLSWYYGNNRDENQVDIPPEDIKTLIATIKSIRAGFEKRLNTWWKRYGVEKLHTWTYWADR